MKRDVDFLYELGALRHQPRQWQRFFGMDVASITEHHFRVMWLALIIAARQGQKVNTEKIMKMALVHDIAESRTGDVDYLARQYVVRQETDALTHMLAKTSVKQEFLELWEEYEKRQSIESRIVKDADNLDVDMELMEMGAKGHSLKQDWSGKRRGVADKKLYTATAKKMFAEIMKSNPNDWHNLSPYNRVNGGDWKE